MLHKNCTYKIILSINVNEGFGAHVDHLLHPELTVFQRIEYLWQKFSSSTHLPKKMHTTEHTNPASNTHCKLTYIVWYGCFECVSRIYVHIDGINHKFSRVRWNGLARSEQHINQRVCNQFDFINEHDQPLKSEWCAHESKLNEQTYLSRKKHLSIVTCSK